MENWAKENSPTFSELKTQSIRFSRKRKSQLSPTLTLTLREILLQLKKNYKIPWTYIRLTTDMETSHPKPEENSC